MKKATGSACKGDIIYERSGDFHGANGDYLGGGDLEEHVVCVVLTDTFTTERFPGFNSWILLSPVGIVVIFFSKFPPGMLTEEYKFQRHL